MNIWKSSIYNPTIADYTEIWRTVMECCSEAALYPVANCTTFFHGRQKRLRKMTPRIPTLRPQKLLDRVRDALRLKHYSIHTEAAYVNWIKRYIL